MELVDNKYYNNIMFKYFVILIDSAQFEYRQNQIFLIQNEDDKALGVYEAINELASLGEQVLCLNFNPDFPVVHSNNLHYIDSTTPFISTIHCDYLIVYSSVNCKNIKEICDYYNPKFIFHC